MTTSTKRLIVVALAAALVNFVWGGFSHLVLLQGVGFSQLRSEDAVLRALRGAITEDGLYYFPGLPFDGSASPEQTAAWQQKFRAGPTGLIVFHPEGGEPLSPRKLLVQLLAALVAGAIVAFVLSRIAASSGVRILVAGLLGAFSVTTVSTIYWNWYGFPDAFFLAQCVDLIVGWTLAGAVAARLLRPPASRDRPT